MPIRLAIIGLPLLLSELIAEAFTNDDVEVDVFAGFDADIDIDIDAIGTPLLRHELMIVGVTDPAHSPIVNRISCVGRPRLLGVRTDGRESWLYRMQPTPTRLGPVNPAQIRAALLAGQERSV